MVPTPTVKAGCQASYSDPTKGSSRGAKYVTWNTAKYMKVMMALVSPLSNLPNVQSILLLFVGEEISTKGLLVSNRQF